MTVQRKIKTIFRCGLVVRISGFHPGGPGSIPGTGIVLFIQTSKNGIFVILLFFVFFGHRSFFISWFLYPSII